MKAMIWNHDLRVLAIALPLCLWVGCSEDGVGDLEQAGTAGDEGDWGSGSASGGDGGDPGDSSGAGDDGWGDEPEDDGGAEDGSTGGTTGEPTCDDQTPVELFLSPDDSNSMSSPAQVRAAVLDHWTPLSAVPIRTWEFMNYYGFDYPPADPGSVTVVPQLHREADGPEGEYVLQIGVASETISNEERAPMNVTLVLDTSGSMGGHPIEMARETCRAIAASLREGDVVSMVTWNTSNTVVLAGHAVTGPNDPLLLAAIEDIEVGGATDLHGGLVAGYELSEQHYDSGRINRMVLISDGGANVGVTDISLIAEHAGGQDEDGIYMVGVGVGTVSTYHDDLMDDVTDAGKGASVFIATAEDAQRFFHENFVNTMAVAARDVQVRLDLPPGFEIVKFSGEEYSSDPTEIEPQHLAPNDAMVFHQRLATCAPELVTDETPLTVTVRYKNAVTFEPAEISVTKAFAELLEGDKALLLKGAAIFAYAEALQAYKAAGVDEAAAALAPAVQALALAEDVLPGDPDLAEIRQILEAL